jgi:hypothetical protein
LGRIKLELFVNEVRLVYLVVPCRVWVQLV